MMQCTSRGIFLAFPVICVKLYGYYYHLMLHMAKHIVLTADPFTFFPLSLPCFKGNLHSYNNLTLNCLSMPKFPILQVKGEITFNGNSKWKSLWLLNLLRAAILDFMTCYGCRYLLEAEDLFVKELGNHYTS